MLVSSSAGSYNVNVLKCPRHVQGKRPANWFHVSTTPTSSLVLAICLNATFPSPLDVNMRHAYPYRLALDDVVRLSQLIPHIHVCVSSLDQGVPDCQSGSRGRSGNPISNATLIYQQQQQQQPTVSSGITQTTIIFGDISINSSHCTFRS